MRPLFCVLLMGCIAPGIEVQISNDDSADPGEAQPSIEPSGEPPEPAGEPSSEPANEPSEEPLELDVPLEGLNDNVDHLFGRLWMYGYHLIFDGDLALRQVPNEQTELEHFLNFQDHWGFGVTMSPFNQQVKDYMYGEALIQNGNQIADDFVSTELPLFSTAQRSISVQFFNETDEEHLEHGCDLLVRPRFTIRAFTETGELCEVATFPGDSTTTVPDGMTSTFCVVNTTTMDFPEIPETFQMIYLHRDSSQHDKHLQIWLNQHLVMDSAQMGFDYATWSETMDEECQENRDSPVEISFGKGRVIPTADPMGPEVIHHLHARVDNLVIIDPGWGSEEDFISFDSSLIWHSNAGGDATATNLYRNVHLLFNDPVEDGFAWWSFDRSLANLGDYSVDEIEYPTDQSIFGWDSSDFQLFNPETNNGLGSSVLQTHYVHETNRQWCEDGWVGNAPCDR